MQENSQSEDSSLAPGFNSVRDQESAHQRRALLEALDAINAVEDKTDRVMTEILETGAFWRVHGPGGTPSRHMVEIQLHGVRAVGGDVPQAIDLWMANARRSEERRGGDVE